MICQVPSVTMKGGSRIVGDERAVEPAAERAAGEADRIASGGGNAVAEGELAHDHRGQDHDGADREIDAGGQDDERLGRADDAGDRHLLQDERQGEEEFRAHEDAEDSDGEDQDDERHGRRIAMQEVLRLLDRGALFSKDATDVSLLSSAFSKSCAVDIWLQPPSPRTLPRASC